MTNFLLGLIVGSISSKNNKSNKYGPKSVTAPKPKLPPRPSTNIGINPLPKSKSPGPPGGNNMITLKFCKEFNWNNIEIIELNSYKEFFIFYQENHDKGCIYDVNLK